MKIISQQPVNLKNNTEINEKAIQDYIFEHPEILGLGDLQPVMKEKTQPLGGRLDMLFKDEDGNRYEVELQLGPTDPSHIIRTLEYWDTERKRYPQFDHTAVIIAEDITSRFQNVISLFNNQIPLIALQLTASLTHDGQLAIAFVKVMDVIKQGTDEEEYIEPTDRNYWEKKSTKGMVQFADKLFDELGEVKEGYKFKYNKYYIGVEKDGIAKNFISFIPKKSFVKMYIYSDRLNEIDNRLDQAGLDIIYNNKYNRYSIKYTNIDEFINNKSDILKLVNGAKARFAAE